MSYVARSPGQKCQRCGADNSMRSSGTKWCYKCAAEMNKQNARNRKAYVDILVERDKAQIIEISFEDRPVCPVCRQALSLSDPKFCSNCGQRLKWSN